MATLKTLIKHLLWFIAIVVLAAIVFPGSLLYRLLIYFYELFRGIPLLKDVGTQSELIGIYGAVVGAMLSVITAIIVVRSQINGDRKNNAILGIIEENRILRLADLIFSDAQAFYEGRLSKARDSGLELSTYDYSDLLLIEPSIREKYTNLENNLRSDWFGLFPTNDMIMALNIKTDPELGSLLLRMLTEIVSDREIFTNTKEEETAKGVKNLRRLKTIRFWIEDETVSRMLEAKQWVEECIEKNGKKISRYMKI